jgi:predicted DNA-binding transcriptional regulator YafY
MKFNSLAFELLNQKTTNFKIMDNEKLTPSQRVLYVFKLISENSHRYTLRDLAKKVGVADETVKEYIKAMKSIGYAIKANSKNKYGFEVAKPLEHLKDIMYFNEQERNLLHELLYKESLKDNKVRLLRQKLEEIYDWSKLGDNLFDNTFLTRLNILEKAKKDKKVIRLINYPSTSSNGKANRTVEAFHISPKDDMIQAYDLDKNKRRHFRISRIKQLEATDIAWQFDQHHKEEKTDPFRIVDNNQVDLHIRVGIGAYNELVERFPLTREEHYLTEVIGSPNQYDLECKVNSRLFGVSNFIRGYAEFVVEVYEPLSLKKIWEKTIKNLANDK